MKKIIILGILFLTYSCAHLQDGRYIRLRKDDSLNKLSSIFGISAQRIAAANRGRPFQVGRPYLIPLGPAPVDSGPEKKIKNNIKMTRKERRSVKIAKRILKRHHLLWPVPSKQKISSHFGKRWGKAHRGIDIAAARGTHILAADDGVVVHSAKMGGYGRTIVIAHHNSLFTVYAHNKINYVREGERVARGEVIGQVGQSGKATGPHLHFEIRKNGQAVNPSYALFKR